MESKEVDGYIRQYEIELKARGKSESTVEGYCRAVRRFLSLVRKKPLAEIRTEDLKVYQVWLYEKAGLSSKSVNIEMSGIRNFYRWILKSDIADRVPRMKEEQVQVEYFSEEEVGRIIDALDNPKHRLEIMLTYDCGLRVGELTRIRIADIDLDSRIIHLRQAKGKKDRRVSFSEIAAAELQEYIGYNRLGDLSYLFEGQRQGEHISKRSIENVIADACLHAGVRGKVNPHKLRHSFATHHILNGTDVSMVQQLLGHSGIKTTLRYVHVANQALKRETPLAALMRKRAENNRELGEVKIA